MLLSNNSSSKFLLRFLRYLAFVVGKFAIFLLKLNNIPYCWQVIKLLSEGKDSVK